MRSVPANHHAPPGTLLAQGRVAVTPTTSRRRMLLGLALGIGTLLDGAAHPLGLSRSNDLRSAISASSTADLPGLLRLALEETRTAVEAGAAVSASAGHDLGALFGGRLWSLATSRADFGDVTHFVPLNELARTVETSRQRAWSSDPAIHVAACQFHASLAHSLDRSARGLTGIVNPAKREPGELRVLITGFDPFTGTGWNPSAAAALTLNGAVLTVDRDHVVRISSVVLPVDYRRFAQGLVESSVQPALASLDAIVTMSMEPVFRDVIAVERYAVNFHWVDPPVCATNAGPAVVSGPIPPPPDDPTGPRDLAVLPTWGGVDQLAEPGRSDRCETFVRSNLRLRFASESEAVDAMRDLEAPPPRESKDASVILRDSKVIARLLTASARTTPHAQDRLSWKSRDGGGRMFEAEVTAGPGGNFLSNEVSYRVLRLIQRQSGPGSQVVSFHVHTPNAPATTDPAAELVRGRVIAEMRRLVVDCMRRHVGGDGSRDRRARDS